MVKRGSFRELVKTLLSCVYSSLAGPYQQNFQVHLPGQRVSPVPCVSLLAVTGMSASWMFLSHRTHSGNPDSLDSSVSAASTIGIKTPARLVSELIASRNAQLSQTRYADTGSPPLFAAKPTGAI